MPIYEYEAEDTDKGCKKCRMRFEIFQRFGEEPLLACPKCGTRIKKLISRCRAAVAERSDEELRVQRKIREYEREGMWSHAAELADTHSEASKDKGLKMRALENYQKAGYDTASLDKHLKDEGT
jgi:putative FmdB family regulatory protein